MTWSSDARNRLFFKQGECWRWDCSTETCWRDEILQVVGLGARASITGVTKHPQTVVGCSRVAGMHQGFMLLEMTISLYLEAHFVLWTNSKQTIVLKTV